MCIYGLRRRSMKAAFWEISSQPPMTGKNGAFLFLFCALHAACNGIGNIFSLLCAQRMEASIQFPLLSAVVIVLSAVLGLLCFRERIERRDLLGMVLAAGGVVCFML